MLLFFPSMQPFCIKPHQKRKAIMKNSIKLVFLAVLILSVFSCQKEGRVEKKLELRFENKGQDKIKDFQFQDREIGTIPSEGITGYYTFQEIHVLENFVSEHASAKSEYGQMESWLMIAPDEDWTTINSGRHTIELTLYYGCGIGLSMELVD